MAKKSRLKDALRASAYLASSPHLTVWHATLDTRSFTFDAYGLTRQQAMDGILRALQHHRNERGLAATWAVEAFGDVQVNSFATGAGYRNRIAAP